MAAPTIVAGHTTAFDTSNGGNHPINTPTHIDGDFIYIFAATDVTAVGMNPPAGFAVVGSYSNVDINSEAMFSVWRKVAASEGASYTWTTDISERAVTIAVAVRGDGGIHATGTDATGASATATIPAVVTSVADCLRISAVFVDQGTATIPHGTATGHTFLEVVATASAAAESVQYKTLSSSGTDASQTVSLNASESWVGITFAIAPTSTIYNQAVSGAITPTSSLRKTITRALAGSLTPTGALVKSRLVATKVLAGAVGMSGALARRTTKLLIGVIVPASSLLRSITKRLAGSIAPSGSLTRSTTEASVRQRRRGTIHSHNNLSFLITASQWSGSGFSADYSQDVTSYDHSHAAIGGFWTANLGIRLPLSEIEDWLENGVGRQVQAKGRGSTIAWEGIVNRVTINAGGYNMTVGPYMDIANKVKLSYSIFLQLGGGNATGVRATTDYLSDAVSQGRYGILSKNFSAGGIDSAAVDDLRAMLLERYRQPQRSEDLTIPGDTGLRYVDAKLECIGYAHLFQKYLYNNATTGTQNLSDKLTAIVAAEPNALFSSTIVANLLQVPAYEADDAEAWGLIKSLIAMGDASLNRYTFGVYENRRATYKAITDSIVYVRPLREGSSVIQDAQGGMMQPWEIRPGVYIQIADLLPGRPRRSNPNDDSHTIFADTVQYRMPDSLIINGAHSFRVEQRLAQLGISGVS